MKLASAKYSTFPATALRPEGWLKQQLRIQAEGLSGNLDKIWPDIRDSRWIGGPLLAGRLHSPGVAAG